MGEIDNFFGVAEGPGSVSAIGGVAGVGAGGGVALQDGDGERAVIDFSSEATVALAAKFSVPCGGGHPDFDFYFGVGRGLVFSGYAAEGGELLVEGRIAYEPRGHGFWRGE